MVVPHDKEIERDVLGALLLVSRDRARVLATLQPDSFWVPEHQRTFAAIGRLHDAGQPINVATVAQALGSVNGTREKLLRITSTAVATDAVVHHAGTLAELHRRRLLLSAANHLASAASSGDALNDAETDLRRALDTVPDTAVAPGQDLDDFVRPEDDETEHEWVITGCLELIERLIVTGLEGHGKSTLLRQIGIQIASGIHPFTLTPIPRLRVSYVDLENPRKHLRRELRTLRAAAGADYATGHFRVHHRPEGLDLADPLGRAWLAQRIAADHPDLVLIGPLYKMVSGDPKDEEAARTVAYFLDGIRTAHGCAIIIEAHVPYAGQRNNRPERPYGASLWSRWPEFGIYLAPEGDLRHWRGPRGEREWPHRLKRGGDWPWTVETDKSTMTFARLMDAQRAADQRLSERDLSAATGIPRTTLQRALDANKFQWDALLEELEL